MGDEVIAVRDMNGHITIAVREPNQHQFPAISPPRYVARAEVWDANDMPKIARAFGWDTDDRNPEEEEGTTCPECGGELDWYELRSGLDSAFSSQSYCKNCGYKEELDE